MDAETDLTVMDTDVEPSLDAAVTDSPSFRACVANFEDQVEALERWLDHLCKLIKTYSDDLSKRNEDSKALAKKVVPNCGEGIIDPDLSMEILHIFANCLQNSFAFEDKLVSDIESNLLQPLTAFIKDDFRELKEARRANDKAQEKYEAALARYAAVSKAKEASALREDAFQLYEIRKAYVRASMGYTLKIVKFRASLDHLVIEQFVSMTFNQLEHHGSSYQIYKNVKSSLDQLNYRLEESRVTYDYKLKKLQKVKKSLEDEIIQSSRPNTLLQAYFPAPGQPAYYNPSSVPSTTIDDNNPEKEGYLFKRVAAKGLGMESWVRRWFWLRDGKFGYSMTATTGKLRGQVVSGGHLQVLLCEARLRTSDVGDRRFCFEVVSSRKNFVLQGETEEELNDWLTVFSKAKTREMQSVSSEVIASIAYNSPVGPTFSISTPASKRSPTNSANNLITSPSAETAEVSPLSSKGLNISDFEGGKCDTVVVNDALIPAGEASTTAEISEPQTVPNPSIILDATPAPTPPVLAPPSKQAVMFQEHQHQLFRKSNNAIGDKFISLLSGNNGSAVSAISSPPPITVVAPPTIDVEKGTNGDGDPETPEWKKCAIEIGLSEQLMQRNDEIHLLIKSLPARDCVVDVFMCTLDRQHACLRGRAYVTQWNFCFYASVLSLVTSFVIPFARIESIVFENHELYSTIAIMELATTPTLVPNPSTPPKPTQKTCTTFKVYTTNNAKIYNNLCFAWKNVAERALSGNPPLPLSELYNGIMEESQRMDDESEERGILEDSDGDPGEKEIVSRPNAPRRYHSETDLSKKKNKPPQDDAPPSHIQIPPGPVPCNCNDHLEEKRIDITFAIPVIRLWDMMFGGDGPHAPGGVWVRAYKKQKNIVLSRTPWSAAQSSDFAKFGLPEAEKVEKREVVYTLQVSNPMSKVKETECIETQLIMKKDEYRCYVVISSAKAAALPYADAFSPQIKYCLTHAGTGKSRLLAHLGIKWFKSPMVKGIIKTAAMAGMSDTVVDLVAVLQEDVRAAGRKLQEPGKSLGHFQHISEGDRALESQMSTKGTPQGVEQEKPELGAQDDDMTGTVKNLPRESWIMKMMKISPLELIEIRSLIIAVLSCCLIWMLWSGRSAKTRSSPVSSDTAGVCLVPDTLAEMEDDATRWVPDLFTQRPGYSKEASPPPNPEEAKNPVPTFSVEHAITDCAPAIAWRAVYLRDLEEEILKRPELPAKYQPAFDRFLQSQASLQPGVGAEAQSVAQNNSKERGEEASKSYPWFLHRHFKASHKIALRRNRIAVMRHEILGDLYRLNGLERSLVLAEYMNWLMDETLRCEISMDSEEGGNNTCRLLREQLRRLQSSAEREIGG